MISCHVGDITPVSSDFRALPSVSGPITIIVVLLLFLVSVVFKLSH